MYCPNKKLALFLNLLSHILIFFIKIVGSSRFISFRSDHHPDTPRIHRMRFSPNNKNYSGVTDGLITHGPDHFTENEGRKRIPEVKDRMKKIAYVYIFSLFFLKFLKINKLMKLRTKYNVSLAPREEKVNINDDTLIRGPRSEFSSRRFG